MCDEVIDNSLKKFRLFVIVTSKLLITQLQRNVWPIKLNKSQVNTEAKRNFATHSDFSAEIKTLQKTFETILIGKMHDNFENTRPAVSQKLVRESQSKTSFYRSIS